MDFPHTRLDAYHAAATFVVIADAITQTLPCGRAYLVDQLRRASLSIQANIAEGAGDFSAPDKARFYRMALRSASECAAEWVAETGMGMEMGIGSRVQSETKALLTPPPPPSARTDTTR